MSQFNPQPLIDSLAQNETTFRGLLSEVPSEIYLWRPADDKWNLLDIVCHLYDEEREDFRARLQIVITDNSQNFIPIDPEGWVLSRNYADKVYEQMLQKFLDERQKSVQWLKKLEVADWNISYTHPKFGPMSAAFFLSNWLAHDYLHIRQITRYKFTYLETMNSELLNYAGGW